MDSRKTNNQTIDVQSVKRICRYLQNTQNLGLWYTFQDNTTVIDAYTDADYASDISQRSMPGHIIMYAGGTSSWPTKRQPVVSLSTAKSEFIATSECVNEVLFVKTIYKELTGEVMSVNLNVGTQSTIKMINNDSLLKRSQHIDVRFKLICEQANEFGVLSYGMTAG
ncbi:hypothetical protein PR048_023498 [Dryococelus australis]|uniref:Uncharacterized protein n=1 Tax=Dryococelus australis TaxID=614101 RepID=A0ABQ9GUB0_9NEOP|nr:hypothetical protein PR048_023498 [Dryococelus australis]